MHRGLALAGQQNQQGVPVEELKMLYNVVGAMKREMDMLKTQLEHMQKNYDSRTKIEDEFVEWEQGQVLTPTTVPVVTEDIPEVVAEETTQEMKLSEMEKELMRKALIKSAGNRKAAAAELGMSERTLYRKIKEYGL